MPEYSFSAIPLSWEKFDLDGKILSLVKLAP